MSLNTPIAKLEISSSSLPSSLRCLRKPSPQSKAVTILRKTFEIFPTQYHLQEQQEIKELMILRVHDHSLSMLTILKDIFTTWNTKTASVVQWSEFLATDPEV
jgi:hypothetical protein